MTNEKMSIVEIPEGWYVGPKWMPSKIIIRSDDHEPLDQMKVRHVLMQNGMPPRVDFALIYTHDTLEFRDFHILLLPGGMRFHGRN